MKRYLLVFAAFLFSAMAWGQTKPIKVVFDVTSKEPSTHQSAMRHVKMMTKAYPESQFEVVVYSGALDMVLKDHSSVTEDLLSLKDNKNVSFKVCEASLKRRQVGTSQLVAGVTTVPDGILEIVTKQGEGWAYIKEAH
ncbi:DsrE family protein [Persicitalea sp.]|uniref:DsrE family protein n=1 Tax=Persicitalea sp. TaxID=3100273 RepID=UPI00359448AF